MAGMLLSRVGTVLGWVSIVTLAKYLSISREWIGLKTLYRIVGRSMYKR